MLIKLGVGGVCLDKLHPKMRAVIKAVSEIWGEDPVITSTWEGNHSPASFHYIGRALDFRTPKYNRPGKIEMLISTLGNDYDVVFEDDHIHVEYDPDES